MVQLIPDVLPFVFAYLSLDDATRCARVSQDWLVPGRDRIYHRVTLDSQDSAELLVATLTRSAHLALRVQRLTLTFDSPSSENNPAPLQPVITASLIEIMSQLQYVCLGRPAQLDLAVAVALASLACLTELKLDFTSTGGDGLLTLLGQNGLRVTKLQLSCLRLAELGWVLEAGCPLALQSVTLEVIRSSEAELGYLVASSAASLHTLRYRDTGGAQVHNEYAALLRSLSLPLHPTEDTIEELTEAGMVRILAELSNLVELQLVTPNLTPTGLGQILSTLPNLATLGIPCSALGPSTLETAPPSLRTLHLHGQPGEPEYSAEAFHNAIAILRTCPLGSVEEVVHWERGETLKESVMKALRVVRKRRALKVSFIRDGRGGETGGGRRE